MAFLKRKDGLSVEEFKHYYENHHVDLFRDYLQDPGIERYWRRYLTPIQPTVAGRPVAQDSGFDCVFELWFSSNRGFYEDFIGGRIGDQKFKDLIAEDEEKFLDRKSIIFTVVEDHEGR
jgi:hypothetical protein